MAFIDEGGILAPGTHVVYLYENEERYSGKGNPYWKCSIRCMETQATRFISLHAGFMRDLLRALGLWQGPREYDATEVMWRPFTIKLMPGEHKGKATVNVAELTARPEGMPEVVEKGQEAPKAEPAKAAHPTQPAQPAQEQAAPQKPAPHQPVPDSEIPF